MHYMYWQIYFKKRPKTIFPKQANLLLNVPKQFFIISNVLGSMVDDDDNSSDEEEFESLKFVRQDKERLIFRDVTLRDGDQV